MRGNRRISPELQKIKTKLIKEVMEELKRRKEEDGLTQEKLSEIMGIDRARLSRILHNKERSNIDTLLKLALALDYTATVELTLISHSKKDQ